MENIRTLNEATNLSNVFGGRGGFVAHWRIGKGFCRVLVLSPYANLS